MVIDTHKKNPSQDSKADPIFSLAHMPYLLLFGFFKCFTIMYLNKYLYPW